MSPQSTQSTHGDVLTAVSEGMAGLLNEFHGRRADAREDLLESTLRKAESQARLVVLDLRDVSFMDYRAAHVIVDASRRARQVGRRLVLLRGPPNVDRVFALTGHTRAVEITDVAPGEPPIQALRQRAAARRAL